MLESPRKERLEMLWLHRALVIIIGLLLIYDFYNPTSSVLVRVKSPHFLLLGPHNSTDAGTPVEDVFNQLIDITNFSFKINTNSCQGHKAGLLLSVIVASNPNNFINRIVIRNTWGRSTDTTKVVFLVGETDNATIAESIVKESDTFHDIVQGNFKDAYRNMTYKHVMGLKWIAHYCPTAKYVLKTDDDVVVNSHSLRQFLIRELSPWGTKDLITCQVLHHAEVQRMNSSKWKVSQAEFRPDYYPTYCAGWSVLYSQDVVRKLLKAAQGAPYFWIDDVHVTGVLAEAAGIHRTPLTSLVLTRRRARILTSLGPMYAGQFLFGPPDLSITRMMRLWKAIPE